MALAEYLADRRFQALMYKDAEKNFPHERLRNTPTVVFDRGGIEFWGILSQLPAAEAIYQKIESGDVIPVNADSVARITSYQSIFHCMLADIVPDLPSIPTMVNMGEGPVLLGRYRPDVINGLWVKKTSMTEKGVPMSHMGRGVQVLGPNDDIESHIPKDSSSFLQPFIRPPDDIVRDTRVFVVGGEPVEAITRSAKRPLTPRALRGERVPEKWHYPTAGNLGEIQALDESKREAFFVAARGVIHAMNEYIGKSELRNSPYSTFGFGSIDFLMDSQTPLPVDCDVAPGVDTYRTTQVPERLVDAMAIYLISLAQAGDTSRDVLIIGREEQFVIELVEKVRSILPSGEVIHQEPTIDRVFRQIGVV